MTRYATECVTECDLGKLQAERSAYRSDAMMTGCQGITCDQGRAKCREDCLRLQEMAVVGDEAADASKAEGQAMWAVVLLLLCVFGAFAAGAYGISLMVN